MKNKLKLLLTVCTLSTSLIISTKSMDAAPRLRDSDVAHLNPKTQMQVLNVDGVLKVSQDEDKAFNKIVNYEGQVPQEYVQHWVNEGYFKDYIDEFQAMGYSVSTSSTPAAPAPAEKPAHTHEYTSEVTKDASCVEEGEITYSCSCGNTYTEPIAMTEHVYGETVVIKEATCTQAGEAVKTCTGCGNEIKEELLVVAHVESDWKATTLPTCTTDGEESVVCTGCDEILNTRVVEATGHTKGDWTVVKASTLFKSGESQIQCVSCGEVLETAVVPVNMTYWYCVVGVVCVAVLGGVFFVVKKKMQQ